MNRSILNTVMRVAVGVAVFAVLVAWAWGLIMMPPAQPEPRVPGTILSVASDRVLRASCYDCHSNSPQYVWYDYLPLAATLVAWDIMEGRQELNFSEWDRMSPPRLAKKLKEMKEEIQEGGMPPWYFTLVRRDAVLSPEAQQQLLTDIASVAAAAPGGAPDKEAREHEEKEKREKKHEREGAEPRKAARGFASRALQQGAGLPAPE
jgi:hypothetical protein